MADDPQPTDPSGRLLPPDLRRLVREDAELAAVSHALRSYLDAEEYPADVIVGIARDIVTARAGVRPAPDGAPAEQDPLRARMTQLAEQWDEDRLGYPTRLREADGATAAVLLCTNELRSALAAVPALAPSRREHGEQDGETHAPEPGKPLTGKLLGLNYDEVCDVVQKHLYAFDAATDRTLPAEDVHGVEESISELWSRLPASVGVSDPGADLVGSMIEAREGVGRMVRQVWVAWAREQPEPKSSWLIGWDELDDGQREVDMRIGKVLFRAGQRSMVGVSDPGSALDECGHADMLARLAVAAGTEIGPQFMTDVMPVISYGRLWYEIRRAWPGPVGALHRAHVEGQPCPVPDPGSDEPTPREQRDEQLREHLRTCTDPRHRHPAERVAAAHAVRSVPGQQPAPEDDPLWDVIEPQLDHLLTAAFRYGADLAPLRRMSTVNLAILVRAALRAPGDRPVPSPEVADDGPEAAEAAEIARRNRAVVAVDAEQDDGGGA